MVSNTLIITDSAQEKLHVNFLFFFPFYNTLYNFKSRLRPIYDWKVVKKYWSIHREWRENEWLKRFSNQRFAQHPVTNKAAY